MVRFLFTVGSWLLPAGRRARWREESLALLLEVRGPRRWRYAADLLIKVPVLAWQLQLHQPAARWPTPGAALSGLSLLLAAFAMLGAFLFSSLLGEQTAEALLLLTPLALAGYITRHTVGRARCRATAVPVVVFGAFGPLVGVGILAAGPLAPGWLQPAAAIAGYAALSGPAAWLTITSAQAIHHRQAPLALHGFGLVAGSAFALAIAWLPWQILSNGQPPLPVLAAIVLALFAFLSAFPVWAIWTALRLIIQSARTTNPG
jgi:hypothetical protein